MKEPKTYADGIPVWCSHDAIVDIVKVIPNPNNPNNHPDSQIDLLARIINVQGWRNPIVISNLSGFITKGHARLMAAQKLDVKEVPVDYQDYENAAAEWADILADNKIAELAEPNHKSIRDILDKIRNDIDLDLTGYSGVHIDKLLKDIARHDLKFQPGVHRDIRKTDFIDDEKKALEVPEQDRHLFEGKQNIAVIFSGGIDSTWALFWARQNFPDNRIIGIFSDPGVELPGMALHTYQVCMHLEVEHQLVKPKQDMFIEMVKLAAWPSTILPWCQQNFVYKPVNDWILENLDPTVTVVLNGSRADQVTRMSKKTKTSKPSIKRMSAYTYYSPGYDISRDTIVTILKKSGVPLWWGYERGFKRTACWMCPGMKGEQALAVQENFPGLATYISEMEKYIGIKLDRLRDKSFLELVEVGKRQVVRRARNEAPVNEDVQEIMADAEDA
jgi:3'-phosphoadenosine 5'-phosphosulfate sulfotransferase (PAPS reductase)/FAD synthetase